jgi:peptidoglycan/LPS O-acetylase OafA/YrhL
MTGSRGAVRAAVLDVAVVLVFVVIGRANHHDGDTVPGVASTAWPFLAGLGAGWLVARVWRRPAALVPSGIAAWLGAVAVGMVLRVVAGQGTAVSFIIVALCFLGLFLLGWRLLARLFSRRPTGPAGPTGPVGPTDPAGPDSRRVHDPSAVAAVHRGDRAAEGPGR